MRKFFTKGAVFVTAGMMVMQPVATMAGEVVTQSEVVTEGVTEVSAEVETEGVTEVSAEVVTEGVTEASAEVVTEEVTKTPVESTTEMTLETIKYYGELEETQSQDIVMHTETERIGAATINMGPASEEQGNGRAYYINQQFATMADGSTVIFPAGTYNIDAWVRLQNKNNINIVFEEGAKLYTENPNIGLLGIEGCSNITVEGIVIENAYQGIKVYGNSSNINIIDSNITPRSNGASISIESSSDVTINGLKTSGGKFGVYTEGAVGLDILNCNISNMAQAGVWLQKKSSVATSDVTIKESNMTGCNNAGIWLQDVAKADIAACVLEANGNSANQSTYGLKLSGACTEVVIDNNDIINNKKDGINIDQGASATVKNNRVQKNYAIGICVGNGSNVIIDNNTITQNQDHGIIVMKSYAKITNNTIDGTNAVGTPVRSENYGIIVFCRNSADKSNIIEVSGNKVNGMIGNGIQLTGDKTNPTLEGASNINVTGNVVTNVGDNGITTNYNSHKVNITGNVVDGAGVNGIDVQGGSSNCVVKGNTVNNSGYMGINIGGNSSGAPSIQILDNKVTSSANAGIHITNSATTGTVQGNTVSSHKGSFSIALVNGAKVALKNNTVLLPMAYIGTDKFGSVYKYAIHIGNNTSTTNGAIQFNFEPVAVKAGVTTVSGSGTPGMEITFTLNGTAKKATIDSKWKYSIATTAVKTTDTCSVKASDAYGNSITYTSETLETDVDMERVEAFVERMYTVALNRPYDEKGKAYWVEQLALGLKDGATVAKGFVLSPEIEAQNLSNEEYVLRLYQTFFNRTPADGDSGKAFWINLLEHGVTRAYVFRGFCHSNEFTAVCSDYGISRGTVTLTENRDKNHNVTMYVYRCYKETLGRTPDAKGMNFWTGAINNKQRTPIDVAGNFVFSSEFKNKNLSDSEYVKVLYRMFFGREYDQKGYDFWMAELTSGRRDRYKVFTQFANSAEFKAILAQFGL